MRARLVEAPGASLWTERHGDAGPLLVLLHGLGSSTFAWRDVVGHLAARHRVLVVDLPPFGRSSVHADAGDPHPLTQAGMVAAVAQVIDEPAVVIGNSLGGAVAVGLAVDHRDLVAGLVLASPAVQPGTGPPPIAARVAGSRVGRRLGPAALRAAAPMALGRSMGMGFHDRARFTAAVRAGYARWFDRPRWADDFWGMTIRYTEPGWAARLPEITQPTLVIAGAQDRIVKLAHNRATAAAIPGARLEIIDPCGHMPQEECPQRFLALVDEFLSA